MKKSCSYCGRLHDVGFVCPKKPKSRFRKTDSETPRVRQYRVSRDWKGVREQVLKRDLYTCRVCLANDVRASKWERLEVHHIIPIAEDYSRRRDVDNLITLCRSHHEDAEAGFITREELRALVKGNPAGCLEFHTGYTATEPAPFTGGDCQTQK